MLTGQINATSPAPSPITPLTINTRNSQSSLSRPKGSPGSSQSHETGTQRRRRPISGVLGAMFQSDKIATPPRKLSKPAPTISKSIKKSSAPVSHTHEDSSWSLIEPELATAIRTSGTFGIGDDGTIYRLDSETASSPSSPQSQPMRERTMSSGAGSVQSFGIQRVLFVSNVDGTVIEDDEDDSSSAGLAPAVTPSSLAADTAEGDTEASIQSAEVFYTPIGIGMDSPSSPSIPSEPTLAEQTSAKTASAVPTRPRMPHRHSLSPPAAPSATFIPLDAPFKQRPLTPPPIDPAERTATVTASVPTDSAPAESLSSSQITARQPATFSVINERGEMIDAAIQTVPEPAPSPQRPLPRPPSVSSRPPSLVRSSLSYATGPAPRSPHEAPKDLAQRAGEPRLHFPPPPPHTPSMSGELPQTVPAPERARSTRSSGPASDLPLLIASHLLSTHAAALMRHSTTMRDVSEVMRQMATESLEWGGVLLGMGQAGRQTASQRPGPAAASAPPHWTRNPSSVLTRDERTSGIDGLPSRSHTPHEPDKRNSGQDPLVQAWEKLNGLNSQPFSSPRSPVETARSPTHPYRHGYDVYEPEADRFTTIPPRPSASRKSSRVRLNTFEPPGPPPPLSPLHISRPRPDSLPADWLAEADRLGRHGWTSLRRAEEAWSSAMTSLREIAEQPTSSNRPFFALAEEGERTIRARSRSRHESLDLTYIRRMDRADQIERERSFLPELSDRSSDRPTAHERDGLHSPVLTPRPASGHPLLRPHAAPGVNVPEGYNAEHLGFENSSTVKETPGSRLTMTSTAKAGRETMTGMTPNGPGTRMRKLSKRMRQRDTAPPIPSSFRSVSTPVSAAEGAAEKTQVETVRSKASERGTKRHWWSRRRVESVVG